MVQLKTALFKKNILIVGRTQSIQENQGKGGNQALWESSVKTQKAFLKKDS